MSGSEPRPTRVAALAAFLLFAALLGVTRADASLPKAAGVADLSRPALQLPAVASSEPSRFGFAEDLDLLALESTPGRFGLFGLETSRFERTYARNNPLKYVDPDGQFPAAAAVLAVAMVPEAPIVGALITVGVTIDLVSPFFGGRSEILTAIGTTKTEVGDLFKGAGGQRTELGGINNLSRNPYGKKGGPAHQGKVAEIKADIEARKLEAVLELKVDTPEGAKATRYIDIVAVDPVTGKVVESYQVGRQTQSGQPVSRERKAQDDIQEATDVRPQYVPYN